MQKDERGRERQKEDSPFGNIPLNTKNRLKGAGCWRVRERHRSSLGVDVGGRQPGCTASDRVWAGEEPGFLRPRLFSEVLSRKRAGLREEMAHVGRAERLQDARVRGMQEEVERQAWSQEQLWAGGRLRASVLAGMHGIIYAV